MFHVKHLKNSNNFFGIFFSKVEMDGTRFPTTHSSLRFLPGKVIPLFLPTVSYRKVATHSSLRFRTENLQPILPYGFFYKTYNPFPHNISSRKSYTLILSKVSYKEDV